MFDIFYCLSWWCNSRKTADRISSSWVVLIRTEWKHVLWILFTVISILKGSSAVAFSVTACSHLDCQPPSWLADTKYKLLIVGNLCAVKQMLFTVLCSWWFLWPTCEHCQRTSHLPVQQDEPQRPSGTSPCLSAPSVLWQTRRTWPRQSLRDDTVQPRLCQSPHTSNRCGTLVAKDHLHY